MRLREASSSSPHIFLRCCLLHFKTLLNTASEWFVIKCCLCHFGRSFSNPRIEKNIRKCEEEKHFLNTNTAC